jgi:hypothetical protein
MISASSSPGQGGIPRAGEHRAAHTRAVDFLQQIEASWSFGLEPEAAMTSRGLRRLDTQ